MNKAKYGLGNYFKDLVEVSGGKPRGISDSLGCVALMGLYSLTGISYVQQKAEGNRDLRERTHLEHLLESRVNQEAPSGDIK
ncbi:hypothetical protein HN747_03865 [archaeon]|jgi:hypothetical protein|nr:hypothetical protein [archaeon]